MSIVRSLGPASLALIASLALALSGCPGPTSGPGAAAEGAASAGARGDALDLIKARKKLIVGTDAGYDPFEVTEPDGTITGFDVDLCREIAKDLGVELELQNINWSGIIGALRTGKVDTIFSGMSVTDERDRVVDFTTPYYSVGQVVVKRAGDARITSWRDLNDAGFTIAIQEGTTGETAARRLLPYAKLLRFPKIDAAALAVVQKKADAVIFDHPGLKNFVRDRGDGALEGLWEHISAEPIGGAVREDSPKLLAAINTTLARLERSGRMAELRAKYFDEEGQPAQAPGSTSGAQDPVEAPASER